MTTPVIDRDPLPTNRVSRDQLAAAHCIDLGIQAEEGVSFERAWLDPAAGKVFCLSSGPNKEAVMRIHARAGHPTQDVDELASEISSEISWTIRSEIS